MGLVPLRDLVDPEARVLQEDPVVLGTQLLPLALHHLLLHLSLVAQVVQQDQTVLLVLLFLEVLSSLAALELP